MRILISLNMLHAYIHDYDLMILVNSHKDTCKYSPDKHIQYFLMICTIHKNLLIILKLVYPIPTSSYSHSLFDLCVLLLKTKQHKHTMLLWVHTGLTGPHTQCCGELWVHARLIGTQTHTQSTVCDHTLTFSFS